MMPRLRAAAALACQLALLADGNMYDLQFELYEPTCPHGERAGACARGGLFLTEL